MAYESLSLDDYKTQFYDAGAAHVLIDVRTDEEYAEYHIPGAVHLPLDDLSQHMAQIEALAGDDNKPVVLACRTGMRSAMAAEIIRYHGLSGLKLYNLEKGSQGWKKRGWPTE